MSLTRIYGPHYYYLGEWRSVVDWWWTVTDRVVDSVGQKLNGCPARVVSVGNEIYCGRFITVWVASCHTATIHHCAGPQLMKNLTCSAPTITERPLLGKESESGQTSIIICFTLSSAGAGCNTSWARSKTLSRLIIHLMCVALRCVLIPRKVESQSGQVCQTNTLRRRRVDLEMRAVPFDLLARQGKERAYAWLRRYCIQIVAPEAVAESTRHPSHPVP